MSNTQFKLTGGSRIPAGLPARMDIIVALEATVHCDDRPPVGGIDSTNIFVTFKSIHEEDRDPYTGYGRVSLHSDSKAIIVPQFEEGIEDLGIRNLKAGDTFNWPCGCESIVRDLADLAPAFDSEYDVQVVPSPEQQIDEMTGLSMLLNLLDGGDDAVADMRDFLAG